VKDFKQDSNNSFMKNQKYRPEWLIAIAMLSVFLIQCTKDSNGFLNSSRNTDSPIKTRTACELTISYDATITSSSRPLNESDRGSLSQLEQVSTVPYLESQNVDYCLESNGTVTVDITHTTPLSAMSMIDSMPDSGTEQVASTHISYGIAYNYNSSGQLIHQTNVGSDDFSQLIPYLYALQGTVNIQANLQALETQGVIEQVDTDTWLYQDKSSSGEITGVFISGTYGAPTAIAMYDANGKVTNIITMTYQQNPNGNFPLFDAMYQVRYYQGENGIDMVHETFLDFSNFIIQ
jgi:hypothetical protein